MYQYITLHEKYFEEISNHPVVPNTSKYYYTGVFTILNQNNILLKLIWILESE